MLLSLTNKPILCGLVFLVFLFNGMTAFAQDDAVDVRLIIDVSGSMKRNDPNNLRQPAVELLVELLPEKSSAGVWAFGKWVNMLIPHKEVTDSWRNTARSEAKKINSVGLFTNIGEALEKAAYDIKYADVTRKKHIILLTDGMVDIDKQPQANKDEWRRIVDKVLPELKRAGYVIHTIALSENADRDLMNKLSVSTDGVADIAYSAEDLMKIFLKAFDAAVPSEQVALTDNAFVIDSSVEEFTALIFRQNASEQTELVSPDNQLWRASTSHPDLRWHRTERYDLITVKTPLEGSWGINGKMEPESRITVVSNLNMRVKPLPNNVLKGSELDLLALLQEDGKTITNSDFLSLMTVTAELHGGKSSGELITLWNTSMLQPSSSEGRYNVSLPVLDKEGIYNVKVHVDGKTFTREFTQQVTLREAFTAEIREQFKEGNLTYVLTVASFQEDVDRSKTRLVATITSPDNRRIIRPLELSELDTWQTEIVPDMEGVYRAEIQAKGESLTQSPFTYELDILEFNYATEGGLVESEKPFVESAVESIPAVEPEPTVELESIVEPKIESNTEDDTISQKSPIADWMIYAALAIGNLLLMVAGYVVFKKVMGGPKEDIMADLEEQESEIEQEVVAEEAPVEDELADEDEPPMEDLDPDDNNAPSTFDEEVDTQLDADTFPDLDPDPDPSMDSNDSALELDDDGLDDLDAMSIEPEEPVGEGDTDTDEEEDDMVTAMLKAQGLDLAEEELDDAISSLIDDLDNDDDDDEKR